MHPGVLGKQALRALRANRVSGTDEKHIRTRNTVTDRTKGGLDWLLCKIETLQQRGRDFSRHV
jgi:hypothetical protein